MIQPDAIVVLPRPAGTCRACRVLLVTPRCLVAAGLRTVLSGDPKIRIVGETTGVEAALVAASALRPDVVVLDTVLSHETGDLVHRFTRQVPPVGVILLAERAEPRAILEGVEAGAAGYLLLDASEAEVRTAIQDVAGGGMALRQPLLERCLRVLAYEEGRAAELSNGTGSTPASPPAGVRESLTGREADVLTLIAAGLSNKEIAGTLGIGLGTVKSHLEHVYQKLHVADRTQAALQAVAWGLVDALAPHSNRAGMAGLTLALV